MDSRGGYGAGAGGYGGYDGRGGTSGDGQGGGGGSYGSELQVILFILPCVHTCVTHEVLACTMIFLVPWHVSSK
jgi:hypothetical protein